MIDRPACRLLLCIIILLSSAAQASTLYRWTDAHGSIHISQQYHPHAETLATGPHWHTVARVIDGDTVELDNHKHIRLLGINTPELAHRNRPEQAMANTAKQALQTLLTGHRIRLQLDQEGEDKYHRTLAYLIRDDDLFINRELLRLGMAHVIIKPPNTSRLDTLFNAERAARRNHLGIWQLPAYRLFTHEDPHLHGGFIRYRSQHSSAAQEQGRYWIITLDKRIQIRLHKRDLAAFPAKWQAALRQSHITIDGIRGWLHRRHGQWQMRLNHPLQLF